MDLAQVKADLGRVGFEPGTFGGHSKRRPGSFESAKLLPFNCNNHKIRKKQKQSKEKKNTLQWINKKKNLVGA